MDIKDGPFNEKIWLLVVDILTFITNFHFFTPHPRPPPIYFYFQVLSNENSKNRCHSSRICDGTGGAIWNIRLTEYTWELSELNVWVLVKAGLGSQITVFSHPAWCEPRRWVSSLELNMDSNKIWDSVMTFNLYNLI